MTRLRDTGQGTARACLGGRTFPDAAVLAETSECACRGAGRRTPCWRTARKRSVDAPARIDTGHGTARACLGGRTFPDAAVLAETSECACRGAGRRTPCWRTASKKSAEAPPAPGPTPIALGQGTARACLGGRTFPDAAHPGGTVDVRLPGAGRRTPCWRTARKKSQDTTPAQASGAAMTTPTTTTPPEEAGRGLNVFGLLKRFGPLLFLLVLMIVFTIMNPNFLNPVNLFNVLRQISITGLIALGMTFVILTAGIDLSVGSLLALCGMIAAVVAKGGTANTLALDSTAGAGYGWFAALLAAIATGAALRLHPGAGDHPPQGPALRRHPRRPDDLPRPDADHLQRRPDLGLHPRHALVGHRPRRPGAGPRHHLPRARRSSATSSCATPATAARSTRSAATPRPPASPASASTASSSRSTSSSASSAASPPSSSPPASTPPRPSPASATSSP